MTQVDFYILSQPQQRALFTCRLAEKIYRLGRRVYIHTANAEQAQALDELMWTFSSGSFVPHECVADESLAQSPVVIGYREHAPPADVFINTTDELPAHYKNYTRVAEVVDGADAAKSKARDRFKIYRERGEQLETHQIDQA